MPVFTNHDPVARLTPERMDEEMVLPNSGSCFYPVSLLDELIREDVVSRILKDYNLSDRQPQLTRFVCTKAKRVFAILIACEQVPLMTRFFENRFTDEMLPVGPGFFSGSSEQAEIESFTTRFANLTIVKNTFDRRSWRYRDLQYFHRDRQWPFISPIFTEKDFRYLFHEQSHMPFMEENAEIWKDTNFSLVEKRRIHRDHLKIEHTIGVTDDPTEHPYVAVKLIKKGALDWDRYKAVADEEAEALEMLRDRKHNHLIRAIGYYTLGKNRYILSPWAGLGNLREFWEQDVTDPTRRALSPRFLDWMFTQLCGLSDAVQRLHSVPGTQDSWRHGDLKPENILCFEDIGTLPAEKYLPCVLVIADVGLTRHHTTATQERQNETRTKSGTIMYEPPETELDQNQKKGRSRRYDIWSMGCIYLEFIIWLLYGSSELKRMVRDLGDNKRFYEFDSSKKPKLHHVIEAWTEHIRNDRRCPTNTALRWLLDLVVDRLLSTDMGIIPTIKRADTMLLHRSSTLSESNGNGAKGPTVLLRAPTALSQSGASISPSLDGRASAEEMNDQLQEIYKSTTLVDDFRLEWMMFDEPAQRGPDESLYGSGLTESDAKRHTTSISRNREVYGMSWFQSYLYQFPYLTVSYTTQPLDDKWEYGPDAEIAHSLSSQLDTLYPTSYGSHVATLCVRCRHLELWRPRCDFSDTLAGLKKKGAYCTFCLLLHRGLSTHVSSDSLNLEFSRVGSSVACSALSNQPIASLYTLPAFQNDLPGVQISIPELREPGSQLNINTMSEWIRSCGRRHSCLPRNDVFLPTRVLDVGSPPSTSIRLVCFAREHTTSGKYLALSHRWGSTTANKMFRTLKENLEAFKQAISIADLPTTFRQAVQITRSLGIQYIWIDSLCIVQDDSEDWDHESGLMEKVFSSAYATIAATCATGTNDGFLKSRPKRQCVLMKKGEFPYYVCEAIDNFYEHVEQADLNKRGWVLQERALSRRTIHFTERQCYWECGGGVRCETFTKMKNRKASFLGDADFPRSVESYVKGMKIELFQDLYSKYSNLALSYNADRPIAIRGLEKRLLQTLDTKGGFGIFDVYLHRCLLWQRTGNALKKITAFHGQTVPSWSWMAYEGGIKYMNVPFGQVDWSTDVVSPFAHTESMDDTNSVQSMQLKAPLFNILDPLNDDLILDETDQHSEQPLKCIIVGTSKDLHPDQKLICYTLLVRETGGKKSGIHERVGVARLRRDHVASSPSTLEASIQ
ncbi:hypothetical protein BDV96DRAFT_655024 [Lophiotrema nucula]|uniref:Protein kinase domain-containing protein n=1 Tax=Lophiotrema nucula TaxID=690887 RepID=A0A6A5YGR7_9PLEO|nr:hypothetical protein BDV96DRAFT_655024 [Lophiotrema nucula]